MNKIILINKFKFNSKFKLTLEQKIKLGNKRCLIGHSS